MAGVNGAGINGPIEESGPRGGLLGAPARAQYAALASLRWQMLRNSLRSVEGVFELGARAITLFFAFAVLGLGLGALVGFSAYTQVSHEEWVYLPMLFWLVFFLWQVVPVMQASFQEQFDLSSLLRFPVSFGLFFLLYIIFGLADVSTIMGGMCCVGLWLGITVARPALFGWTALAVGGFAAFNILLSRAVLSWIDRWLAQRKTREILAVVFMVAVLSLQLLNPAIYQKRHTGTASIEQQAESRRKRKAEFGPWLKTGYSAQEWFPPGLAAVTLRRFAQQRQITALGSLGVLGMYVLAAGGLLAVRLRAEYRGENLGHAPSRSIAPPRRKEIARSEVEWRLGGSGPITAVIEKELRTLLRTMPLLYALGAPLLLVLVFSGVFFKGAQQGHTSALALPVSLIYAQLGFTQLFYNNLGVEGAGIQVFFLSPTPIRTVLLAKNLFHSLLYGLVLLAAGILATLRLGLPDGAVMAATAAWLLFSLPCNLAAGNLFSLLLPYRVNPGRMIRQRGSRTNALLSLLSQTAVLGVGATVFGLCLFGNRLWLAVPIFLALAGAAAFALACVLRNADGMANRRRDSLIATLVKKE